MLLDFTAVKQIKKSKNNFHIPTIPSTTFKQKFLFLRSFFLNLIGTVRFSIKKALKKYIIWHGLKKNFLIQNFT